jgi:hypothetical protein
MRRTREQKCCHRTARRIAHERQCAGKDRDADGIPARRVHVCRIYLGRFPGGNANSPFHDSLCCSFRQSDVQKLAKTSKGAHPRETTAPKARPEL